MTTSSGLSWSTNHSLIPEVAHWADVHVTQEEELALLEVEMDPASCETLQPSTGMRRRLSTGARCLSTVWPADYAMHTHLSNNPKRTCVIQTLTAYI